MPVFTVQLFKNLTAVPDREWTNVYHVFADTLSAASALSAPIAEFEQSIHMNTVTISRARVSTLAPGDDAFNIIPLGLVGAATEAEYLPLYNTVRADIATAAGGRPDRKYYRLPLGENGQHNGVLEDAVREGVQSQLQDLIDTMNAESGVLVSADTGIWETAAVAAQVQMRQLHRKRRRTVTP